METLSFTSSLGNRELKTNGSWNNLQPKIWIQTGYFQKVNQSSSGHLYPFCSGQCKQTAKAVTQHWLGVCSMCRWQCLLRPFHWAVPDRQERLGKAHTPYSPRSCPKPTEAPKPRKRQCRGLRLPTEEMESWNHERVRSEETTVGDLVQFLLKQAELSARAHGTGLCPGCSWISPRRDSTTFLDNLFQCSVTPTAEFFLLFRWNFSCISFCPLPPVLEIGTTEKSPAPSSWHTSPRRPPSL